MTVVGPAAGDPDGATAPDGVTAFDGATVVLRVPRVLAADVGGAREVRLAAPPEGTLASLLDDVARRHPALGRRVRDETGALRRFVNLYVDGTDVRHGAGLATPVGDGQVVEVIQSVAGG